MYKKGLRYTLLVGMIMVSLSAESQPPYMIEKVISPNQITNFNNQKLLIIDFWATWCSPCAPATKQLEILQETKPDDVFIVSVSDEKEETISAYLKKIPIRLAVLKDYLPNSMIDLFSVQRRPYSVLLTLDGNILYEGHPSGITIPMIEKYASRMKSQPKKKWSDLFYTVRNVSPTPNVTLNKELIISRQPLTEQKMYIRNGIFQYSGPFSGLVKYLTDCSNYQIVFKDMNDFGVSMSYGESELSNSKLAVLQLIEKRLSLNLQTGSKPMEAYVLYVVNPKLLWDNKQIDWGSDMNPVYMVGTDRIEADNITLKEVANLLSDIKGNLYYYKGNDNSLHDWNFHYHYNDLMNEDLEYNFGIRLKKEKIILPLYIFSPQ
ncbi:MAG: TlpA family protein disulfide reductase [Candidatus Azobacteroides sp.]|nr:TlpA family protein disulfide reductase [Candidatus Azobacteroides sp.]